MRRLINRLPRAKFKLMQATARATKCTASLSGMPRGGGTGGSQVEIGAEMREAALASLEEIQSNLDRMRAELRPLIDMLPRPLERIVMQMRYMDGNNVREIAYRISYSEQHIFRVLERAEKKISRIAKDESYES